MMANIESNDVNIIRLGHPQVDINRVMNVINENQSKYRIIYQDVIPNLGNSDLEDFAYSDDKLFGMIAPFADQNKLTIGVTSVALEENWFLRPNEDRSIIIITIFEADSLIENAERTIEEYVICQILTSILTSNYFKRSGIQPGERLLHDDCRGCLFDFCGYKSELVRGLQKLDIDSQCRGILIEGNVPEENIDAILSVLKYIKRPSLNKTMYSIKVNPYLTMIFGIGVGIMVHIISQILLDKKSNYIAIILILLCTVGIILGKYFYDIIKWLKK